MAEEEDEEIHFEDEDDEFKVEPEPVVLIIKPSNVPDNIVELKHSFGYDCKRLFNLCLIDPDTLLFASGNLLHYYSISKNETTLRRTVFGGGVGFIMKNHVPEFDYLTIAENGTRPTVFIYKYPEHAIVSELKGAAERCFTTGVYSNNGELLGTQAGTPDFMLTIWNWQTSSIILRSKAYQNDVLNVVFSQFNPILLATCGLSHVQFWKMATTFTGLKLKSDLGRFGKTDTCDVYSVYMLADEKVISGCEWGNMLVWEGGLIKLEVTRKARIPCHTHPITRIIWMDNNELMTIGMDGYARIWFWETVELADPPEEDRFVEIDPIFEFRIGDKDDSCECRHLLKAFPQDDDDYQYYSQDGKGGVWLCDLNTVSTPKPPKKLFSCHGGRVVSAQASPTSHHIATLGEDGKVNIYNYETEQLLLQEPFNAPGGDLLWLDTSIDPSGMVMIVGFANGVIREIVLQLHENKKPKATIYLLYALKAHATAITCLGISPSKNLLVSGAMDDSAFLYHVKQKDVGFVEIVALGFLRFEGSPTCMHWAASEPKTVLFGCMTGEVYECELPEPESIDLEKVRPTWRIYPIASKSYKFISVKSRIRRELEIAATMRRKARKLAAKKKEMKRLMQINPGLQFDESALADSSEEDEEEKQKPLYIPDPPSPVLWLQYTNEGTVWLSMGGYDAGYVYEIKFGKEEPISCTFIPEGDDIEIHSYLYIENFLVFGMQTGQIRVNAVKSDFRVLNDFWTISMHDNLNGVIPKLFTSHDGKWFFSIGHDGNVFLYYWKGPFVERICDPPSRWAPPTKLVQDIEDPHALSLEEIKVQENLVKKRLFEEAERVRLHPSFVVLQLQVDWMIEKIKAHFQAELDAVLEKLKVDVTGACIDAQALYDEMFLPLEYIPFEVFAIRTDVVVRVFRIVKLTTESESELEVMGEEEGEGEHSGSEMIEGESATTIAAAKAPPKPPPVFIFDFAEKVLLKVYIRFLEFAAFLKQLKTEELERVMDACGDVFEEEEEQSLTEEAESLCEEEGEEEAIEEEDEEMALLYRAIDFLNNTIKDTVEVKKLEISILYEIIHARKDEYNKKVLRLKKYKARLYEKTEKLRQDLMDAEEEMDLPTLREWVMYHEYPDVIFREPFVPLRSFESILWEKPMKKTAAQIAAELAGEEEEIEVFSDNASEFLEEGEEEQVPEIEEEKSEEWLVGMDGLLDKIEERIVTLDTDLEVVLSERCGFELELKYLCYLLEISEQELVILQDSETMEKYLVERDEMAKMLRSDITVNIKRLETDIQEMISSFTDKNEEIKSIGIDFYKAIKDNKFFKFLRRIYEKKFKPQRERDPDEESESESSSDESSTDEEEEQGSGESGDMTAIQLDESHCPPGCDRKLYDLAFELRTARHTLEQEMYDGNKSNDMKKVEIEDFKAKIPAADEHCKKERTNLMIFRHQKNEKLRAVEFAVIYSIEGFGLDLKEQEERTDEYIKYLENLLEVKKVQAAQIKEELQGPIETYLEKLRILLEILEERERLRRLKPVVVEAPPPEKEESIISYVRPPTPPPPFDFEAYAREKILKLVTRFFVRYLAKHMSETLMRKCIPKVAHVLANIGRDFTCELADNIIEVVVENLARIVPKKYLMHATLDDVRSLFKDIIAVFESEPVEVDPVKVMNEAVDVCIRKFAKVKVANKTQRIVLEVAKIICAQLPMDDLRNVDTPKYVAKLLAREPVIIPNCFSIDVFIEQLLEYAKSNRLSAVTWKIARYLGDELKKELIVQKIAEIRCVNVREKICKDVRRKKRR